MEPAQTVTTKELLAQTLDKFLNREVTYYLPTGEDFDEVTETLIGYTLTTYGSVQYYIFESDKGMRIVKGDAIPWIRGGE